jgi:outer membrane cobalamin receptor
MRYSLALLAVLILASACGIRTARHQEARDEGQVITAEQIARSGARDAWEVLKISGTHLSLAESGRGEPKTIRKRGTSSIALSAEPWIMIDEAQLADIRNLRQIPASTIESVRILSGTAGTAKYGTGAGNGVIIISTKH